MSAGEITQSLQAAVKATIPARIYRPLLTRWRQLRRRPIPANMLSGLEPVSRIWGLDRGSAIDHYYIEKFLSLNVADIRGATLEMADSRYTRKFGGDRVSRGEVLHLVPGNPEATLVGDLATGAGIPRNSFDCLIVVNTFLLIYDVRSAIANCYQALKEGGVLLAHFTGIANRCPDDAAWAGDYWRFTSASARQLCEEVFPGDHVTVTAFGNVRTATAYLYGLAAEELHPEELDYRDPNYEVAILVRAVKPIAKS
ncbi:MAG: methyltransferase domain-containing protein [Blastocatellia bacterium]|nr:methyltransferase domain-containing protein [Blastocatellia bacterium]